MGYLNHLADFNETRKASIIKAKVTLLVCLFVCYDLNEIWYRDRLDLGDGHGLPKPPSRF